MPAVRKQLLIQIPGIARQIVPRSAQALCQRRKLSALYERFPAANVTPRTMAFFRTSANTRFGETMRPPSKGCVVGLWQPLQWCGQPCVKTGRSCSPAHLRWTPQPDMRISSLIPKPLTSHEGALRKGGKSFSKERGEHPHAFPSLPKGFCAYCIFPVHSFFSFKTKEP